MDSDRRASSVVLPTADNAQNRRLHSEVQRSTRFQITDAGRAALAEKVPELTRISSILPLELETALEYAVRTTSRRALLVAALLASSSCAALDALGPKPPRKAPAPASCDSLVYRCPR